MQALAGRHRSGISAAVAFGGLALVAAAFTAGGVRGFSGASNRPRPLGVHFTADSPAALRDALRREGLPGADVDDAVDALSGPTAGDARGLAYDLKAERPSDGSTRLISLVARRRGDGVASITRAADGALRMTVFAGAPDTASPAFSVLQGPMEDVLYGEARADLTAQAMRLFARKLDLGRDVALGDSVRLVFNGAATGPTALLYAELRTASGVTQFYAHRDAGGGVTFVDADGDTGTGALLRTPLDVVRVTSGFGMRLHPLLGYSRMHEGVDFGAPIGTPVVAAADGVVEQANWAGGYGRWIRLRHSGGIETAYAHLSGWAAGLSAGEAVRRGQVIGYVGSTGLSTGPHLHFEVIDRGRPVDPKTVAPLAPARLAGADQLAFAAEREAVAAALAAAHGHD